MALDFAMHAIAILLFFPTRAIPTIPTSGDHSVEPLPWGIAKLPPVIANKTINTACSTTTRRSVADMDHHFPTQDYSTQAPIGSNTAYFFAASQNYEDHI